MKLGAISNSLRNQLVGNRGGDAVLRISFKQEAASELPFIILLQLRLSIPALLGTHIRFAPRNGARG